jgi:hypothetical protein
MAEGTQSGRHSARATQVRFAPNVVQDVGGQGKRRHGAAKVSRIPICSSGMRRLNHTFSNHGVPLLAKATLRIERSHPSLL